MGRWSLVVVGHFERALSHGNRPSAPNFALTVFNTFSNTLLALSCFIFLPASFARAAQCFQVSNRFAWAPVEVWISSLCTNSLLSSSRAASPGFCEFLNHRQEIWSVRSSPFLSTISRSFLADDERPLSCHCSRADPTARSAAQSLRCTKVTLPDTSLATVASLWESSCLLTWKIA